MALSVLKVAPERCLMVGDRIETDILMGNRFGLATALVLTGVTDRKLVETSEIVPDYILESVADLRTR